MLNELTIIISGEAGQGLKTIGISLCSIFKSAGFNIFANQDYMSMIRGGNNFFQIRVSNKPIYAIKKNADILVCLDSESIELHKKNINKNGIIILDKEKFSIKDHVINYFDVPLYKIAKDIGGSDKFINTVASGVIASILGIDFSHVSKVITSLFSSKGNEIIDKNIKIAKSGFEYVAKNLTSYNFKLNPDIFIGDVMMDGSDAISLGAIKAGCKFFSAYPMTPSTGIFTTIAKYAEDYNIIVEQAEDEIAAVNMIIGASFAGVRSMTGTSGGGFALMGEGISLAGMTETPIVIVEAQRPAPATGLPTRTEQSDLNFVLYSGHGEFARAIFTPGSIEEAFYLTIKAFSISEKYQIPVIIMIDQYLADTYSNIKSFDLNKIKIERFTISKEESKKIKNYKRYALTESGISPLAIPSWIEDVIYSDSDEHTEDGHITEDSEIRKKMVDKRFYKKMKLLSKNIEKPVMFNINNAETVLIGYGSTYGFLKELSETSEDKNIGYIHLPQIWPFPVDEITEVLTNKNKILTIENNAGAQLAMLIKKMTGIKINNSILKYDGRPFNLDYLRNEIKNELI